MKITDLETSIRLHLKYGWNDETRNMPFEWTGRIDKLSAEQIQKGLKENPQAIIMPIGEFRKLDPDEEWKGYATDCTARLWAQTRGNGFFMHFSYPAYTELPCGERGNFIEYDFTIE